MRDEVTSRTARASLRRLAWSCGEIGFGSGHNVAFYPGDVTDVVAIEPSDVAWKLARDRLAASKVPVRRAGPDGHALPLGDRTCDTALTTWTLCTVTDAAAVLAEIRRVLKPGGTVHFLEHGRAPDEKVRRRQRRLEPVQKRIAGGCHLTRPIVELFEHAGFTIAGVDEFYETGTPKVLGADSLGTAISP